MRKKLLFIASPSRAESLIQAYPPLGIAYLSSYLKREISWKTACCDAAIGEAPLAKVKAEKPDLIGVTCTTISFNPAVKIAEKIKEHYPDIPLILGGVHITALPQTLPSCFNAAVIGEGENALVAIARELEETGKLSKKLYAAPRVENLDDLPFPDRDMFNLSHYLKPQRHTSKMEGVGLNIMTSRGCPYRCIFCCSSRFFGAVRGNSARYIADEMEFLRNRYKVEFLNIWDDLFHYSKQRLRDLVIEFRERKLEFKMICQCHAPTFDEETATLLKKLGIIYCGFGLEASTPRMLKFLKCGVATVEDNHRAVRLAHKLGMAAGSGFMINVPGQTKEDLEANERFILEEHLEAYQPYVLTPFPGTPLWDCTLKKGLVSEDMDFTKVYQRPSADNVRLK